VLSLKVFCSTKVPRTSSRTYLIALTASDGIFLLTHFIETTCKEIVEHWKLNFPINITDQKQTMCKSFVLLRSTCRAASPWIIVAFTLERFLVVNFPHHSSIISKPLLAKRFIAIILFMSVLVSLYTPILSGVVLQPNSLFKKYTKKHGIQTSPSQWSPFQQSKFFKKKCDILEEYQSVYLYLTVFYTTMVIILPMIIISVLNALLIARIYHSDKWTSAKLELHEQEMSYKELRDKKVQIENLKITWTLIIISLTFIFLTLPHMTMYFLGHSDILKTKNSSKTRANIIFFLHKLTELFYIFNHSINFFLYIVTRNSFRRVLKEKLKCDCFNWRSYMLNMTHKNSTNLLLFNNCQQLVDQAPSSVGRHSGSGSKNAYSGSSSSREPPGLMVSPVKEKTRGKINVDDLDEIKVEAEDAAAAGSRVDKLQPENYESYWELVTNKNITDSAVTTTTKTGLAKKEHGKKSHREVASDAQKKALKLEMLKKKSPQS
jgi:hypothetical protein